MEELHFEQRLITPQRALGAEADVAIVVVAELGQIIGQFVAALVIGLLGALLRQMLDGFEAESLHRSRLRRARARWRGAGMLGHRCDDRHNEQ
jgi:branched-subunit amino acid ABC-type transport system permease component